MIEAIKKIFNEEKNNGAYRRISKSHPIDIYLGYNSKGEKSLVVIEIGKYNSVISTKIINVNIEKREDEKLKLEFALTDIFFEEMFYRFCEDIVVSLLTKNKFEAIQYAQERWDAWRVMFEKASKDILSDEIIQGLIGELYFLKNVMVPEYGCNRAIKSWDGPVGGHKDFVIDETWYEVKTCSSSRDTITISSIEQLDSEKDGTLQIISIEKSNCENVSAINLNAMVEDVKIKILDVDILELYYKKLANVNYRYDLRYDEINFVVVGTSNYLVDKSFPVIRRSQIPKEVKNLRYELRISELK